MGAVADVDLHAPECMAVPQEPASGEVVSFSNWHAFRCGAVWAGSHVRAGLNLVAADGETLWDDSLTHEGVAPTELLSLPSSLVVDVQAPTSGMLELEMTGASGVHFARLPVASRVADIWLDGDPSRDVRLTVGVTTVLCANGVFDVVDGSRGAVLGAPAVFIGDGPALTLTPAGDGPDAVGSRSACRSVTLTENVPHRFTVTMGTRTRAFTVTPILPSTTALRRARGIATARVVPRSPRPLPGERMSH